MLRFYPEAMFAFRGVGNPYTFMVKAGIPSRTASKILNKQEKFIKVEHLEILCSALYCTPNDLFEWQQLNTNVAIAASHPIRALENKQAILELNNVIKTMPVEKIKEMEEVINNTANKAPK